MAEDLFPQALPFQEARRLWLGFCRLPPTKTNARAMRRIYSAFYEGGTIMSRCRWSDVLEFDREAATSVYPLLREKWEKELARLDPTSPTCIIPPDQQDPDRIKLWRRYYEPKREEKAAILEMLKDLAMRYTKQQVAAHYTRRPR